LSSLDRFLLALLLNVPEDVVQNEVTGWLFSQDESLTKFLKLGGFVGCFTDDLNDDAILGSLRIDIRNADLAVLEIEVADALLNSLT
jgi:hypothetical protein